MQFSDEGMLIDGRGPFPNAPWKDLLELMASPRRRGWDLLGLALAASAVSGPVLESTASSRIWRPSRSLGPSSCSTACALVGHLASLERARLILSRTCGSGIWNNPSVPLAGTGSRGPQREALDEMIRNRPHQIAAGRNSRGSRHGTRRGGRPPTASTGLEQQRGALVASRGSLQARRRGRDRQGPARPEAVGMVARLGASAAVGGGASTPPCLIVAWNGGSSNDVDPALARSIVLFHNVMRQAENGCTSKASAC